MFQRYLLVAVLAYAIGAYGIWRDGGCTEAGVAEALKGLHHENQLPALRGCDSIYWLDYAEHMMSSGGLTMHYTHMDNAPYGRENIGWAAPTMWHVAIIGEIWSICTGRPIHEALLISSQWANPILYFTTFTLILFIGWRAKRFPSAAVTVLVLATAPRLYNDFGYAAPDHHGLHDLTTLGTILCLALGTRNPGHRYWFCLAGAVAAIAIWIGATEQSVTVAGACAGAFSGLVLLAAERWWRKSKSNQKAATILPAPESWRLFGVTACILSLAFYAFEFPHQLFRMRLEVNHPLFSLAFLAGGEFLCRTQRLLFPAPAARRPLDLVILSLCSLTLAGIASACLFGPAGWHVMHQPFIQRFHMELSEFKPLTAVMGRSSLYFVAVPILLVICALTLAARKVLEAGDRMALFITIAPCTLAIAAGFLQFRWTGLAGASAAAIAAVLYLPRSAPPGVTVPFSTIFVIGNRSLSALGIAIPVVLTGVFYLGAGGDISGVVKSETVERMASAEVGDALRHDAAAIHRSPAVIFSGQDERQAWISYVYGIPCVGSLYWDNDSGLYEQAEFLVGYDDEAARRIAKERGITHVITSPDAGVIVAYHFILHGTKQPPEIRNTLAYRLAAPTPNPPAWMQLLPATTPAIRTRGIRIYRVTP